jgi:hypothetical protein
MSNLVSQGFAPATMEEAMKFSEMLARSSMVPRQYQGKPEDVMVACQWGREIGLAPMQALQNIAVINGKPSVYGDAAMALVQASPVCEGIEEMIEGEGTPNPVAVCIAHRKGRKPVVAKFSVEDAKRAGLWGKQGPWQAYPKRMLQMRARGFALRDAFPDVLKGLITAEEAADFPTETKDITPVKPANPLDMLAAPVVPEPAPFNGTWAPEIDEDDIPDTAFVNEPDVVTIEAGSGEPPAEPVVIEAQPEFIPGWELNLPGKTEAQKFSTEKEWSESYDEICAKVMASKLPPAGKLEKLDQLKSANAAVFKRMDVEHRLIHTTNYAKRKAELGLE